MLPPDYPISDVHMIADELKNEWNIFSDDIKSSDIYNIIKSLSTRLYSEANNYFSSPVGVPEKYDKGYLKIHSILVGHSWDEFVESIKHENRFHTQLINTDKLETYLSYLRKTMRKVSLCIGVACVMVIININQKKWVLLQLNLQKKDEQIQRE